MKIYVIAILLSVLGPTAADVSAAESNSRPRWVANLREKGFVPDYSAPPGAFTANRQIVFGSTDELVVVNDTHTTFNHPGPVTGFVLDPGSGQIVNKATWRAKGAPFIFATSAGNYAINTDTGLVLYSAGLRTVKESVPHLAKLASPDGTAFAAWKAVPGPHGLTYFLDAGTLRPTGVEYLDMNIDTICQDRCAFTPIINSSHTVQVLGPADVVSTYNTKCSEPTPHFLSIDVLAVSGCDRVEVIDTSHGLRFSYRTEAYDTNFAGASRDGSHFVIAEAFYGRGDEPKLRFERFTVIDLAAHGAALTVEINELRGRRRGASGAALSPDGSLLAINSLGVVQLFHVSSQATDTKQP